MISVDIATIKATLVALLCAAMLLTEFDHAIFQVKPDSTAVELS